MELPRNPLPHWAYDRAAGVKILHKALVRDHGRRGADGGDYADAPPAPLHRLDQAAEIAIAGEDHHMIDTRAHFHPLDNGVSARYLLVARLATA